MTTRIIIPDLHADPDRLEASLKAAGDTRFAFLGDFIDAGENASSDDEAVLKRVRTLVEERNAVAIMGNHELNAILFHRTDEDGNPLREHSKKNRDQHKSFVDIFDIATPGALEWTEWFLTLPLWLELDRLRLVHACWDNDAIATVARRRPDGRLRPEDLPEVAAKKTPFAQAVETLTSGPEVPLPSGHSFHDIYGNERHNVRVAWWKAQRGTWRDVALSVPRPEELPDSQVSGTDGIPFYPDDAPPVFVGHYKMPGSPRIEWANAACLDYPAQPCVYRWEGEQRLQEGNLLISDEN